MGPGFCAMVLLAFVAFFAFRLVLWIEIGPRLVYRTLLCVHTHQWTSIKAIQFTHSVACVYDEEGDHCSLCTHLQVTWTDNKIIRTEIPCSCYCHSKGDTADRRFDECRRMIVHGLVEGLRNDDPCIRRGTADAIGRFHADAVRLGEASDPVGNSPHAENAMAQGRAAAFKALLDDAIPNLKKAMGDPDANVRTAATEALRRIESRGI